MSAANNYHGNPEDYQKILAQSAKVRDNRSNANSKSIHSKEDKNISIVVADPLAPTKEVLISIQ